MISHIKSDYIDFFSDKTWNSIELTEYVSIIRDTSF